MLFERCVILKLFGKANNDYFISKRVRELGNGKNRVFVDVPAGKGNMSAFLKECGFDVRPFDLHPEGFSAKSLECKKADLTTGVPLPDASADFLLCEEGIEHIPDQLSLLKEFNRTLKPGGTLFLTTPNISCLRCRISYFLMESEFYRRLPPTELDAVWFSGEGQNPYYGHIFLINVQKLAILAKIAGFRLRAIHPMKISWTSFFLGITYPVIALANYSAYLDEARKKGKRDKSARTILKDAMKLNLNPTVLFSKHLFAEFEKACEPYQSIKQFHQKLRSS